MSDRVKFILNTSAQFFSVTPSAEDSAIKEFFQNEEITILAATSKQKAISFQHKVPNDEEDCLLFYKIPRFRENDEGRNEIPFGLLTLEGGIIKSIYNSVSRVYSPHIGKRPECTPELENIIENLNSSLGSSLGLPQSGIVSVRNEISFWQQKAFNSPTKSGKENAKAFINLLEKINTKLKQVQQNTISAMEEFLDVSHTILDEIWRLPHNYPQNKMTDLMDIICTEIIDVCTNSLSSSTVWDINAANATNGIGQVSEIIDAWLQVCDSLTRLFWPNYGQHPWTGAPHIPQLAVAFKERLDAIDNIKALYKQIASLFYRNDDMMMEIGSIFTTFKDVNVFNITPFGQREWRRAISELETILQTIDERMAFVLKSKLHNHLQNTRQVIHIFSQYHTVLKRPDVIDLLKAEREHYAQSLHVLINDLRATMSRTGDDGNTENMSPICWESRWLKVIQHEIRQIDKTMYLIKDSKDFETVNKELTTLKDETETLLTTNYEIWTEKSVSAVKSGELRLNDEKPVVEFEKEGRQLMLVTFNPKLVTFCRDVREFQNMGYRVPIELRESASHATKFMAYARVLQRIASFHNTIGDRMVLCQRPIMLNNAMELSRLIQSESVAWNDEASVSRYVNTLQDAVNQLSSDNTYLASHHEQIKRIVMKLMDTDLLRQGQLWKDEMRKMRNLVAVLESKGYTNLETFKLHWDYQLYKVLEYQYILGLSDINQKLPEIYLDIVFRQQSLQLRPPIEEIRLKYYTQLRKFIERPLGFRGLSDQSNELFKIMLDRNRHYFGTLYKKAEDLFKQLCELRDTWLPWVSLGCVNLDNLCDVHLLVWEDWDRNFRDCKHFSQQIAKIQNSEEYLDCFVINMSPLRADIESISRKFWDALSTSLKQSILQDVSVLQDFLHMSLQLLQNVPLNESGIAEAGAKYERIMQDLPKMSELLDSVQAKDTCLAGWCKERVSALSTIVAQWDKLQPLLKNHSSVLQRQIDIMRDQVAAQIDNLNEEAEKFQIRWDATIAELENSDNINLNLFKERQENWKLIKSKRDQLLAVCEKFSIQFSDDVAKIFDNVEADIKRKGEQWELFEQFTDELEQIAAEEFAIYRRRPYVLSDFLTKWTASLSQSSGLATARIRKLIDEYHSAKPILQNLQTDALTERHWATILHFMGKPPKPYHDILLKDVLSDIPALINNMDEIQSMVRQAASEQIVKQALTELDQWGVTATLKLTTHTDSRGEVVTIIKDFKEVLNKIGDNQCLLQSAKNTAASETFSDQADIWEGRLNTMDRILTSLNQIQRKWIYLEPIFGIGTLRTEEAMFNRIDKDFRYIMREISRDNRILSTIKINNILTLIDSLEDQLSRCQNTLSSYITMKRNAFPRFYFLGDDDLLEILGQASKLDVIQKHIKKLFPGVHHLTIESRDTLFAITGVNSAEGDAIQLNSFILMDGPIENWLNQLVVEIKMTLQRLIQNCALHEALKIEQIKRFPMQVLCTVNSIAFTKRTEKAITSMSLPTIRRSIQEQIEYCTAAAVQTDDNLVQIKIRALLLDLVHYATIIEYLMKHNVTNLQDWHWLQQLKFYLNEKQMVFVKMVFGEFEYSYEYLGNANKLVHTRLTHNCYLTLTQAMHLGLGGNPFGPAGTGKTECIKALGNMLGRLVLVFNCSENVDAAAMGLILSGLARCGAWGCFDEFNRLQEATLSAISMLIQPLQMALKEKLDTVTILDKPIPLSQHCGVFVTLNPAGEEYGGRQKLPGNLQALFRPIVMQQPEPSEIARVLLFIEGFRYADDIGARIVELFDMASKLLSPQRHYDWGLRELKIVLLASGKALRLLADGNLDQQAEIEIAVKALRSNTMSKLNQPDCERFDMLIADVFPGVTVASDNQDELRSAVRDALTSMGLIVNDKQVEKCVQLHEQLTKRMGVVVLGPPTCGKTTIISVLKQALTSMAKTIRTYTIAPKSMSRVQLLGKLNPDTRQWNDGVLTTTAVAVNSESSEITSWIICDGDVDPEWIEALNSVLDDNKLLTLPSGWRIQFGDNVNFIFETHDLSHASPATISRMGIVNLSTNDLQPSVISDSWLQKRSEADAFHQLFDQYLPHVHEWLQSKKFPLKLQMSRVGIIKCILQCIDSKFASKESFFVGLLRGLGSLIEEDDLASFAQELFQLANIYVPDRLRSHQVYFDSHRDAIEIYETDTPPLEKFEKQAFDLHNTLIKTSTTKVHAEVVRTFLSADDRPPFLLVGPAGCGKSILLRNVASEFSGYQLVTINCSGNLTANYILYILKQNCLVISGVRGREYKPKYTRLVLCLKNIDLCATDAWGSCEVIELLLQIINRSGFYADTLEWISLAGLQICATISGGEKCELSPRFQSIVRALVMGYPSNNDMKTIVRFQLASTFVKFRESNLNVHLDQLVDSLIAIFATIQQTFTKAVSNHYTFTPKMITKFIEGLADYPFDCFQQSFFNEMRRTFQDRLMNQEDVPIFEEIMRTYTHRLFNIDESEYYFAPLNPPSSSLTLMDAKSWQDIVQRNITICCTENICIETPTSNGLLQMISSVCRALSRRQTMLVLCGLSGSAREDALHIACTILHVKSHTLQPIKSYGITEFHNDLKMAMQLAALDNQAVVLEIDHVWIRYLPEIMKPIEAVLEGSDISELFGEDLESVANSLKAAAQLEGYPGSISSFFLNRIRDNLHLVLYLEKCDGDLNELFREYPALYRNTEMIWFKDNINFETQGKAKQLIEMLGQNTTNKIPIPNKFASINEFGGQWSLCPRRFQQLVKTYFFVYTKWFDQIQSQLGKLQAGVDRLSSAHSIVANLKAEASQQEEALGVKRKLANQALEMISVTMRNATDQRTDLLSLKQQTHESSEKLLQRKKAIELELKDVEPILKEATAAVGQIKAEALSEIRSLRAPPETIRDILEGVLRLMGIRDTSWNSMKTFLAKRGVKEDIRLLDPARISPENCESVAKLLKTKADSFEERNAKRASVAAAPLAAWVIANVKYSKVMQSIRPLEMEQNQLQRNLEEAEGQMKSLMTGLDDVDAKVKELSGQLNVYTQEAAVLEIKLNDATKTIASSEELVVKLGTEYKSWSDQLTEFNRDLKELETKAFLLAVCINYFSDMTIEKRNTSLQGMLAAVNVDEFDLTKSMIGEQDKVLWESMGLTPDAQSIQNAALLINIFEMSFGAAPIPLLIDPSSCCLTWLLQYLTSKNLAFEVATQQMDRFTYTVELAVRFGKILVIKDCDEIHPPVLALIFTRIYTQYNKKLLQVGNKLVDLNDNFKIIFVTRMNQFRVSPEIQAYLTTIRFTTTASGLTDQLMSKSIQIKRPELEDKRKELLQNEGGMLKERLHLQDKLLQELSNAQGNILKNEELLRTLNEIKESSASIDKSLQESARIKETLMQEYNQFKNLCTNAANFYTGMSTIYDVPVHIFSTLFTKSVKTNEEFVEDSIYGALVRYTYANLSRSIPKADHTALALNTARNAFPNQITDKMWESFVTNLLQSEESAQSNAIPQWIKKEVTSKVLSLKLHHSNLYNKLNLDNEQLWRNFATGTSKKFDLPVALSEFEEVLTAQAIRPDILLSVITKCATKMLGISSLVTSPPTMSQLALENDETTPILIIATADADPSNEIRDAISDSSQKYVEISIGKGQESQATMALRQAAKEGSWICFKNVHLVPAYLKSVDAELNNLQLKKGFRLWLICDSTSGMPESLLIKSSKILFESPDGLKNKMRRLMQQWSGSMFAKRDVKLIKLYMLILLLNAVLQERRVYIPQGWTKWYDFGDSDLKAGIAIVGWLEKSLSYKMDWSILCGLAQHIAFGGRINNAQDLSVLACHLDQVFNAKTFEPKWSPPNLKITIPQSYNSQDYQSMVAHLPDSNSPESLGLSSTSVISKDLIFVRNILKKLRSNYFLTSDDHDNYDKRIKPILALWKKLSTAYLIQIENINKEESSTDPWKSFILSEQAISNKLTTTIHMTLASLHASMKTISTLSSDEKLLLQTIGDNQVPLVWRKIWQGPKILTDYMKSVVVRAAEANNRYSAMSNARDTFLSEINLSLVFNVDAFLAALKLKCARHLGTSTNDLTLVSSLTQKIDSSMKVAIAPLAIDGAFFKNERIIVPAIDDNEPGLQTITPHFELSFTATTSVGAAPANRIATTDAIALPVYSNCSRENLICTINVASSSTSEQVILSGAALIIPEDQLRLS